MRRSDSVSRVPLSEPSNLTSLDVLLMLQGETCELFSMTLYHEVGLDKQLALQDICQQDITLVDQKKAVLFNQAASGPSCL